jgi:uncharacterized protein (TIGR02453 family)
MPGSSPDAPSPFGPGLFRFLTDLAANNDREWFDANRDRYEAEVREPALRFIMDFGPRLHAISPHFRADPRKQGGSLFRIHRNLRFQPDAPPFKTHTGIQFRHEAGRDAHAPGFYLHLAPGECFVGVGSWRPHREVLRAIRDRMVDDPDGWRAVRDDDAFQATFELSGDALKLGPRGYDRDHPLIEDLKRKDLVGVSELREDEVTAPGFAPLLERRFRAGAPLVQWLCAAADVPF